MGRVFLFLLRAPGGFVSHAADHRPADAQIGQFAAGQVVQFAHRLLEQGAAGKVFAQGGNQGCHAAVMCRQAAGQASVVQIKNCHFHLLVRLAAGHVRRFVRANMRLTLRLHNRQGRDAAMQKSHGFSRDRSQSFHKY